MILHHESDVKGENEWEVDHLPVFHTFILSWNASRPIEGQYFFYVSVKRSEWSPWLLYVSWGSDGQASFSQATPDKQVQIDQDTLQIKHPDGATGFRIRMILRSTSDGEKVPPALNGRCRLHVYIDGRDEEEKEEEEEKKGSNSFPVPIHLGVSGLSQMTIDHSRHADLCSPASTTAVIQYLANDPLIDPIHFAHQVWDKGADIFGNWVFNVAEAADQLGEGWSCWVEKLNHFDRIYESLLKNIPAVVSIRGPLQGSALSYSAGHLVVVVGYDPLKKEVICMDPAFPSDHLTLVRYALSNFIEAWSRRGYVAYLFVRNGG